MLANVGKRAFTPVERVPAIELPARASDRCFHLLTYDSTVLDNLRVQSARATPRNSSQRQFLLPGFVTRCYNPLGNQDIQRKVQCVCDFNGYGHTPARNSQNQYVLSLRIGPEHLRQQTSCLSSALEHHHRMPKIFHISLLAVCECFPRDSQMNVGDLPQVSRVRV